MIAEHLGISGIDITSSGFLHDLDSLFKIGHELKTGLELYPTLPGRQWSLLKPLAPKLGLPGLPVATTPESVHKLLEANPNTFVSRVHLPFFYSFEELVYRLRKGPTLEHSPSVGQQLKGLWEQKNLVGFYYFWGSALNMKGVELAHSTFDQGTGINAHPTIIQGFEDKGKLRQVRKQVGHVLVENDMPHKSLLLKPDELSNPSVILRRLVYPYKPHVDGLLIGLDHIHAEGQDGMSIFRDPKVSMNVRAFHLAKSDYSLITENDRLQLEPVLRMIGQTVFRGPVRLAVENYPQYLIGLSYEEKLAYFRSTVEWVKRTTNYSN